MKPLAMAYQPDEEEGARKNVSTPPRAATVRLARSLRYWLSVLQPVFGLIQAAAAVVSIVIAYHTVVEERHALQERAEHAETERRQEIVNRLSALFLQSADNLTPEEAAGILSAREIMFINQKLAEKGESWRLPLSPKFPK